MVRIGSEDIKDLNYPHILFSDYISLDPIGSFLGIGPPFSKNDRSIYHSRSVWEDGTLAVSEGGGPIGDQDWIIGSKRSKRSSDTLIFEIL